MMSSSLERHCWGHVVCMQWYQMVAKLPKKVSSSRQTELGIYFTAKIRVSVDVPLDTNLQSMNVGQI